MTELPKPLAEKLSNDLDELVKTLERFGEEQYYQCRAYRQGAHWMYEQLLPLIQFAESYCDCDEVAAKYLGPEEAPPCDVCKVMEQAGIWR